MKDYKYWIIPIILFFAQLSFTNASFNQIRYEELAESVRNVFWLDHGLIYDGVSSNIGWYGTLLFFYKVFGFSLNFAKYYRLILHLVSIIALAAILKKYLGYKAIVPLVAISLSPALLYFNILQTSYGLDLQYVPIIIWIIISLDFKNKWHVYFLQPLAAILTMIAWMSYPTVLFYLPSLALLYFYQLTNFKKIKSLFLVKNVFIWIFFFFMPLFAGFMYIQNKSLLIFDPILKSGIFRGAGTLEITWQNFSFNSINLLKDLFDSANSYYYEVYQTDFSQIYPSLAVILSLFTCLFLLHIKKYRFPIILFGIIFIFGGILANLTVDPTLKSGLRRNTAILFSLYGFYTIAWYYFTSIKWFNALLKIFVLAIFLMVPIHHIFNYPANIERLNFVGSIYRYTHIFGIENTPTDSLNLLVQAVQKEDLKLGCLNEKGETVYCRYSEGYAAVAGFCKWNNIKCFNILGFDQKTNKFILLSPTLWADYYFEH